VKRFGRFVAFHPLPVLAAIAALTLVALQGIVDLRTGKPRLQVDPSIERLLPQGDDERLFFDRARKVRSLAYCALEVERAGERWQQALALGSEPGLDAGAALAGFARDLRRARDLGPRGRALAPRLARELDARAAGGTLDEITAWLVERESRLVQALAADAGEARMAELGAEIDAGLERWRQRMPARVLETLRREALARRLLEAHALPRLSLFHLEAGGAAPTADRRDG